MLCIRSFHIICRYMRGNMVNLYEYLTKEYNAHFSGRNFSCVKGRILYYGKKLRNAATSNDRNVICHKEIKMLSDGENLWVM
jgi:hypothetical protein